VSLLLETRYYYLSFIHILSRNLDAFEGSDDVLNHELSVAASRQIDTNELSIPTGKFVNVAGTPSDFRKSTKIGARWNQTVNLCGSGTY